MVFVSEMTRSRLPLPEEWNVVCVVRCSLWMMKRRKFAKYERAVSEALRLRSILGKQVSWIFLGAYDMWVQLPRWNDDAARLNDLM